MKKILLLLLFTSFCFGQGRAISFEKKNYSPIVLSTNDTLKVDMKIKVLQGSNIDGSFKFVQLLNNFNEPIKSADSRAALMTEKIKFFKSFNEVAYLFTKFFCINIEAAILAKEIEIVK